MNLNSYYSRIVLILSSVFWLLFMAMGITAIVGVRQSFIKTINRVQGRRIEIEFSKINKIRNTYDLKNYFYEHFAEVQVDLYDSAGVWVTGNNRFFDPPKKLSDAEDRVNNRFVGFGNVYYNPWDDKRYKALVISWESSEQPVFSRVLLLLLIFSVATVVVAVLISRVLYIHLNKRLNALEKGVSEIKKGNFQYRLEMKGNDEISRLGGYFDKMSEKIMEMFKKIEQNNQERERFIAHASHEIRTPVTSIKGFVDIVSYLGYFEDDPPKKELLETVRKDVRRIVKITDDLRSLSSLKEQGFHIETGNILVKEFVREEHRYFENRAKFKEAEVFLEDNIDSRLTVIADPERMSQILDNLWNNALKYADLSSPVLTKLLDDKGILSIIVENLMVNPIQVDPRFLFEPFYRYPKDSERASGAGLGLSLVKTLTEKMGGHIKIEIDNKNKIFRVILQWTSFLS